MNWSEATSEDNEYVTLGNVNVLFAVFLSPKYIITECIDVLKRFRRNRLFRVRYD